MSGLALGKSSFGNRTSTSSKSVVIDLTSDSEERPPKRQRSTDSAETQVPSVETKLSREAVSKKNGRSSEHKTGALAPVRNTRPPKDNTNLNALADRSQNKLPLRSQGTKTAPSTERTFEKPVSVIRFDQPQERPQNGVSLKHKAEAKLTFKLTRSPPLKFDPTQVTSSSAGRDSPAVAVDLNSTRSKLTQLGISESSVLHDRTKHGLESPRAPQVPDRGQLPRSGIGQNTNSTIQINVPNAPDHYPEQRLTSLHGLPMRSHPSPKKLQASPSNATERAIPMVTVPHPTSDSSLRRHAIIQQMKENSNYVREFPDDVERFVGPTGFSKIYSTNDHEGFYRRVASKKAKQVERDKIDVDLGLESLTLSKSSEKSSPDQDFVHPRDQVKAVLTDRFTESVKAPLRFSNEINDRRLSGKFQFVSQYVYRKGIKARDRALPGQAGCSCTGRCDQYCSCLRKELNDHMGTGTEYVQSYERRPDGTLVLSQEFVEKWCERVEISECNERCSCSATCGNRLVQNGRTLPLEVFETERCGFGVRSPQNITRGQFIELYLGEVITENELIRREQAAEEGMPSYVYSLDWFTKHQQQQSYHVDGVNFGSTMRFVNHSCSPNARTFTVLNHQAGPSLYFIAFFAVKDIPAGNEITIDYDPTSASDARDDNPADDFGEDIVRCKCGEPNCRIRLWGVRDQRKTRRKLLKQDVD